MNATKPAHRPKDFDRVSAGMLLRLERCLPREERAELIRLAKQAVPDAGVPWGAPAKVASDVLGIMNRKRMRDGLSPLDEHGLKAALRAMMAGERRIPAVEELSDALASLREMRLGIRKVPLLDEGPVNDNLRK